MSHVLPKARVRPAIPSASAHRVAIAFSVLGVNGGLKPKEEMTQDDLS
jgi:hypothetical protein